MFRFPAQEMIAGASKVPSIIYYDGKGRVKAIGAEAIDDVVYQSAIDGHWHKAEWYICSRATIIYFNRLTGSSCI